MTEPYLGEVRLFGGTFAPVGWADCNGQLLPISGNDALYALLGTAYGGDGVSTFGVPDMRGRAPVHQGTRPGGSNYVPGQTGGAERVTVTTQQLPAHTHTAIAATSGQVASPAGAILASAQSDQAGVRVYSTTTATTTALIASSVGVAGGSQSHENMQPYLGVRYIIATQGIFPSRS